MEKCPYRIATYVVAGIKQVMFTYFIKEDKEQDREIYETGTIPDYKFNVVNITDAIINNYYSKTEIDTIIRDYNLDPDDEDYAELYNKLKELKNKAKQEAKFLVKYVKDNSLL